ncbi:universal stress protein [Pseudonocardia bannensis]|uniref:Universal stress protein n=1 Tax=Pseudonocardia bannensis TaxID=630973 RepID=A0A848DF50_9PSEU|nr:universal stress protein [Pseudonocardia bannensis]NMH91209.1 universal stress protein [Pseudonocardia bannensis]
MDARTTEPRRIVVGVDQSDSARHALAWAADIAAAWHAPLCLVHTVLGERDDAPIATVPTWLRELLDAADRAGAGSLDIEIVPGGAVDLLVERSAGARLLVLGSYGDGAWSGMLAGSTAFALIGRAACPVAVVRGSAPQIPPPRGGPIVVGVDDSAAGAAALEFAAELAESIGAPLVAVHTWSEVVADGPGRVGRLPEDGDVLAARGAALLDARLAPVLARHPGLRVERQTVENDPLRELLDRAGTARLLVVGHRGSTPSHRMLLGSTSHALVEFAPCPVVVTKPITTVDDAPRAEERSAPVAPPGSAC